MSATGGATRNVVRALLAGLVVAVLACGCSTLPTQGEVHTKPDTDSGSGNQAPYFAPPGPKPGDDREGVVRGFLLAMQANPPSTAVARSFLSTRAKASWKPVRGTIVYDASDLDDPVGDQITVRLSDAHRLDPQGGWDTGPAEPTASIDFTLVREDGEWRIDNPQNALAVPASYFSSLFVPFHLYFFDKTGTVLVPTRVYLPRGEQTASNLVRGLLAGPPASAQGLVTTAFPAQADLDFAVLVSDSGVAEVPLGPGIMRLSADELDRVLLQLSWTLRQVPGINRIRLSVDGVNVPLPDGQADIGMREGTEYDPTAGPDRTLVGIVKGRVVRIDDNLSTRIGGPLGRTGFALRSVALDASRRQVAAVAANGRRLYVAPDRGPATPDRVKVAVDGATDLLGPVYDRFGSLWSVDRTPAGAVVHVTTGGVDEVVRIPGVTGRRIAAFTLTRDGTRFAAALAGGAPRVAVAGLVRTPGGRFDRALTAEVVPAGDAGLGAVRDIGQVGDTTLAVLTQAATGPGRIVLVELDGSPGEPGATDPDLVPGTVASMAASPDPTMPLRIVTADRRLLLLDESGQWVRSVLTDVRAAEYPG